MSIHSHWQDLLLMQQQLTEAERMIQQTAADVCQRYLAPRIQHAFEAGEFDPHIMRELGDAGLLGATLTEFGGAGISYVGYGLVAREVERIDSGYRSALSVQSSLVMWPLANYGSATVKETYLPKLATGEYIGCFGLTEPDAGSDPASMKTRAQRVAGGYRLTGSKMWITNSPIAKVMIVWAVADDSQSVRGFVVDCDFAGVSTPALKHKLSLRASLTGEIVLDNVFVPDSHVFADIEGLKGPFSCLNYARYGIAWGVMGAAECCWHAARDYTLSRRQFGRPLAQTQLVQKKLADMQTEISLGLQAALRVGQLLDTQAADPLMISMIKRNNCGKALDIARVARDMHGANGISGEYPVMRHLINLETVNTYEGTHDVHALILGRGQTGLQAFY